MDIRLCKRLQDPQVRACCRSLRQRSLCRMLLSTMFPASTASQTTSGGFLVAQTPPGKTLSHSLLWIPHQERFPQSIWHLVASKIIPPVALLIWLSVAGLLCPAVIFPCSCEGRAGAMPGKVGFLPALPGGTCAFREKDWC